MATPEDIYMFDISKAQELREEQGFNFKQIGEIFNLSSAQVRHRFKKAGLAVSRRYTSVSDSQVEKIVSLYKDGHSCTTIEKLFPCNADTILRILRDNNVPIKKSTETHFYRGITIDQTAFEDINSEPAAYFYGWILTDGNLSRDRVSIELSQKDEELLVHLKEYLKSSNSIHKRSRKDGRTNNTYHQCSFSFSDHIIVNRLRVLGLTPRKSVKEVAPEVLLNNRHFWRGVIEGDGSLSKTGTVNLVGSYDICSQFLSFCQTIAPDCKYRITDRGNLFAVDISGRPSAKSILDVIYGEATLKLSRKYNRYLEDYYGRA